MSFFPNDNPPKTSHIADIAYDARTIKKYPSKLLGDKIYVSAYPFINRDCKEVDPNLYIDEAIANGANVIIYHPGPPIIKKLNITYVECNNPREILAKMTGVWYRTNDLPFPIFGITGTKGKTTTAYMLYHILNKLIGVTGLTSSADYFIGKKKVPNFTPEINKTLLSCPEALELSGFISSYRGKLKAFVVENTSHALALDRATYNLNISGGIVTNIGSDHLDFHKTHKNYVDCKLKLIDVIANSKSRTKCIVLNANDRYVEQFIERASILGVNIVTVGFLKTNYSSKSIDYLLEKTNGKYRLTFHNQEIRFPDTVFCDVNAINAAMAVALVHQHFNLDLNKIIQSLFSFKGVYGRFEIITNKPFTVMVDYAHEPMSFEMILKFARSKWNNVVTVFSCTGDRDNAKRPIMGGLSAKYSDYTIITNDSTHSENPTQILKEIEDGYRLVKNDNYEVIDDRSLAIKKGIQMGKHKGIVLILGMGSENIIERGGIIKKWSDSEITKKYLN